MPGVCEDLLSASRLLHGALPFLPKQTSFSSSPFAIQAPIECSRLRISIGPRFAPLSVRFFHSEKALLLCGAQTLGVFFSEDAVAVFVGGPLATQGGLVSLKWEADPVLTGHPRSQYDGQRRCARA